MDERDRRRTGDALWPADFTGASARHHVSITSTTGALPGLYAATSAANATLAARHSAPKAAIPMAMRGQRGGRYSGMMFGMVCLLEELAGRTANAQACGASVAAPVHTFVDRVHAEIA